MQGRCAMCTSNIHFHCMVSRLSFGEQKTNEIAVNQRGRERKGPGEKGAPRNHPEISSQKLADFERRFPYDSYGRDRQKDFGGISGGPFLSRPLWFTAERTRNPISKICAGLSQNFLAILLMCFPLPHMKVGPKTHNLLFDLCLVVSVWLGVLSHHLKCGTETRICLETAPLADSQVKIIDHPLTRMSYEITP